MNKRISCLGLLLLAPSLAHAHGFGLMFEWIAAGVYVGITLVHGSIIFLLRWKVLFKHLWLTSLSLFVSVAMLLLGFVIVGDFYTNYMEPRYLPKKKDEFILIFILVIVSMLAILWLFSLPIKQYQQLSNKSGETTISINEALGINNDKG
ncbi:MAG: hypothetical protein COA63_009250 [Methylophaga sp.]|nr:hypothetical protein [Methylophaga sp.]